MRCWREDAVWALPRVFHLGRSVVSQTFMDCWHENARVSVALITDGGTLFERLGRRSFSLSCEGGGGAFLLGMMFLLPKVARLEPGLSGRKNPAESIRGYSGGGLGD